MPTQQVSFSSTGPRGKLFSDFWEPNNHKRGFEILRSHPVLEARLLSQNLLLPSEGLRQGEDKRRSNLGDRCLPGTFKSGQWPASFSQSSEVISPDTRDLASAGILGGSECQACPSSAAHTLVPGKEA